MSRSPRGQKVDLGDDDTGCTILHVDMDAFYASVELIDRPELKGKPVIIGGSAGRGVVLSATYEARAFGVHAAMPMSRAQRMCPQAVVIAPHHDRYAEVSEGVMGIFRDITPYVEPLSLDEAFLDVSGAVRRLGRPSEIAAMIRARVEEEQSITCSVGVAANKFVAKVASTNAKPNGMLIVPTDRVVEFLHPMPVGALWGVGPKTEEQLHRLGLRTVGDLAHTPVSTLERALGVANGQHFAELAWGRDDREVEADEPERSIGNEQTFSRDLDDPEEIKRELLALSEQVARRLRAHNVIARTLTLKVRFADFSTITRSKTLADAGPNISALVKAVDGAKLGRVIDNADRFSAALSKASPDIEAGLHDARLLAGKLSASADKIDAVLNGAESFLGSASGQEGSSTFAEIRAAAISVRDAFAIVRRQRVQTSAFFSTPFCVMTSRCRFARRRRWARTRFIPDDWGLKPAIESLPNTAQARAIGVLWIGGWWGPSPDGPERPRMIAQRPARPRSTERRPPREEPDARDPRWRRCPRLAPGARRHHPTRGGRQLRGDRLRRRRPRRAASRLAAAPRARDPRLPRRRARGRARDHRRLRAPGRRGRTPGGVGRPLCPPACARPGGRPGRRARRRDALRERRARPSGERGPGRRRRRGSARSPSPRAPRRP